MQFDCQHHRKYPVDVSFPECRFALVKPVSENKINEN